VREAAPAVHGAYLLRRLRSRVGAAERARLARDLHDGLIQALVGIEMRLAALRRAPPPEARARDHELDEIRRLLRSEVLNARELMDHLRPLDVAPRELLGVLAENVSRFQRETGIAAEFLADTAEVDLAPRTCREVVQILREALTNVRKHSDARNVLVRVALEDGAMKLIVDDDGRGFPFAGTLGPSDLEARRLGPAVIKERVRAVAGELTIDSVPGRGARLEVRVPTSAHA
jgi:two-component system sensor histidine kinase DegS